MLANKAVSFRLSILQESESGTVAYSETHSGTTNAFGLVNLEIGQGTPVTGTFYSIAWSLHPYYIKVEMDPNGGNSYQWMGTSQLLSVPYALHAKNVELEADGDSQNELQKISINGSVITLDKNGGSVTLPSTSGDNWGSQVAATNATLGGNGTTANPLKIAQQSATSGQVLKWNGTTWAPATDETGSSNPTGPAGGDLTGTYPNPTIADAKIISAKILDGTIAAADLSTNSVTTDKINAGAVTGTKIAQAGATSGQALKWSGTTWAPADDALGAGLTLPYEGSVTTGGISFKITCNGGQGLTSKGWGIGLFGEAESSQGTGVVGKGFTGVSGSSALSGGNGVTGSVTSASGTSSGVYGYAISPDGSGMHGYNSSATGNANGVFGESHSSSGYGVHGSATSSFGTTFGVFGESESPNGLGVYGLAKSTSGECYGVRGQSNSPTGFGVVGHASSGTGINYGVKGQSMSSDGYGVHGMNYATSGYAIGVYGDTQSGTGIGVYGATASTGNGKAIYGIANSTGYAGYFLGGQVYIDTKLGIGKGAVYTLDVVGTANLLNGISSGIALRCNGDEAIWYDGTYFSWGYGGTANYLRNKTFIGATYTDPGTNLLVVNGTAAKPGGGSWSTWSDIRLKDLNGTYSRGLDDIIRLQPVKFSYKAGNTMNLPSDKEYVGFIAQDVQKIFPEAVTETPSGYLEFDMHSVNVAVINAIKELKAENDRLKEENAQFRTRLERMERVVEGFEKGEGLSER